MGAVLFCALLLAACDRMAVQERPKPYRPYWTEQAPPDGTVAREQASAAPPLTLALIERGRRRFDIYCAPCHGLTGEGDGMIVQRGFPKPPSYHIARLRDAPSRHLYDVISNGYGVMYPYAARVAPDDRWAIVAYVRALQASRAAGPDAVPAEHREDLR